MNYQNNHFCRYLKLLSRLGKQFKPFEGYLLMTRTYMTSSIYYYIFCVIFRALYLIMISGNYLNPFLHINNNQKIQESSKKITIYYLFKYFNINYRTYIKYCLAVYLLFVIRLIMSIYILKLFQNSKTSNISPTPFKYQIIIEHITFLFFPYLLEFLAIPFYAYFLREKYAIKYNGDNNVEIIFIMILNLILIIFYNMLNYIYMLCANKNYTNNGSEAILGTQNDRVFEYSYVSYRETNLSLLIIIIFQNIPLIQNIENYLEGNSVEYYKSTLSIVIVLLILLLTRDKLYKYNYTNLINTLIGVLINFCFFSMILDIIFYLSKYEFKNWLNEIIYIVEKLLLSYISHLLIIYCSNKHLEKQILNILFREKIAKKKYNFTNAFIYLNHIMFLIKEKNDGNQNILLINFLYSHITKCNKLDCDCKLLSTMLQKDSYENGNISQDLGKNYTSNLLMILNYLYESSFIEYDYYNNYDLTILLSEHYCHMMNNPTMSFSFVISLLIRQKNKLKKLQKIVLYELCEKYIYYIYSQIKVDSEDEQSYKHETVLLSKQKFEYFQNYFIILEESNKTKVLMNHYINNLIKILKYKSIFEDTLSITYDEGNETITNVQINFFTLNSNIKSHFNESASKRKKNYNDKKSSSNNSNSSNLYKIINILKKEQFYNRNIINSIKKIERFKDIPIFIIYKYYLFFDIIKGGEIPIEIFGKLNSFLAQHKYIYNNKITNNIYVLLKKLYANQNHNSDSKYFCIFQFKKELKTKYFDEFLSIRLGYKQSDIINERIDELMPKDFCTSHQNMIKKLFIGEEKRYYINPKNYIFDASHTVIYVVESRGVMIYTLSNYLITIMEIMIVNDNEYKFMLNHNFELLANTKNFTNDYLLNQKIFHKYKLKLLDMIKMKPEKINQKFQETFKVIEHQKELRQIKTEEYFIPQLYVQYGEKNFGMMQTSNFNLKKNKFLLNLNSSEINNNKENLDTMTVGDLEQEKLLKKEKNKEDIFEIALKSESITIHHQTFNLTLNKMKFVENIGKELTKILDNELTTDTNNEQSLVIGSKKLINDLIMRGDLLNNNLDIEIKLSYYYDRPFYFISINDEKKIMLKMTKYISDKRIKINRMNSPATNFFRQCSSKFLKNAKNATNGNKKDYDYSERNSINSSLNHGSYKKINNYLVSGKSKENVEYYQDKNDVLEKIDNYRYKINRVKFILIIKLLLFIIITGILVLYILNMILQRKSINMIEKILLAYYYNAETKNIILNIFSKLLGIFLDMCGLIPSSLSSTYQSSILNYAVDLRKYYHSFNKNYIEYNLEMGHSFQLIYEQNQFYKLRAKWREILYDSEYCSELDFIIHSIYLIENDKEDEIKKDINIFLFYQKKTDRNEKILTNFIRLVFYFSVNYEYDYKKIFSDINADIYSSYTRNSNKGTLINYVLEIGSLILYLFFFICCFIYLYYSNLIIIKNIIFLFLDFSQEQDDKYYNDITDIIGKIMKFQNLINDFNLVNVNIYSDYLEQKNNYKIENPNENNIESKATKATDKQNKNNIAQKDIISNHNYDIKSKKTANSSQNILSRSNSKLMPDKNNSRGEFLLNNNSNSTSKIVNLKNIINPPTSNNNSSNNILSKKTFNRNKKSPNNINNVFHVNNSLRSETNIKENYQDAILDKSNKVTISIIKIHSAIIIFFLILIISYSTYKIRNNTIFIEQYERFYTDFHIIEERYSSLYYYWNILKALMIFHPDEDRWKIMCSIMENMNEKFESLTNEYNQLLTKDMKFYDEVENLFKIFTYNKNDSIEFLQKNICMNNTNCISYLNSNDSIFNSGIDFGFKICFSYMNNIFMDYQSINNKIDIQEIVNTITADKFYEFRRMRKSFSNVFYYLKAKIFNDFISEAKAFGNSYKSVVLSLNIISLIISILILLFVVIFIFITVSNFSKPIMDSTYRINHSFLFIKNYSLRKVRRKDSSHFIYQVRD